MTRRVLLLIAVASLCWASSVWARTWTDKSGKNHVEADFVELKDGKVSLKKADGAIVTMPLEKLSLADQKFVKKQAKEAAAASESAATSDAAEAPAGSTKVELLEISVGKPLPGAKMPSGGAMDMSLMRMMSMVHQGTTLAIHVSDPQKQLIGFDEKASRITTFTDDKRSDLTKSKSGSAGQPGFGALPAPFASMAGPAPFSAQMGPDGHSCLVNVSAPNAPSSGAAKIILKADLVLRCGVGEEAFEQKAVALRAGGKLTLGTMTVNVKAADQPFFGGDAKMLVELSANQPLDSVKSISFLGPNGQEIKQQSLGGGMAGMGGGGMGFGGQMTYQMNYALAEKVDSVTVKGTRYAKVEPLKVPVSLEAGVGF